MPAKDKRKNAEDESGTGEDSRKKGTEYEEGRQEALEEAGERRIMEEKESVEEQIREHEVRGGHAHTYFFEYDNPSYEDKNVFKGGSPDNEKKNKRKMWLINSL